MPLRVVIPISSSDVHLLDGFVALFRLFGGAPRQDLVLLPTRSMTSKAKIACEAMKNFCRSAKVIEWDRDNVEKWPFAGNLMWQHAVVEMGKLENTGDIQPWYFMELDNTILKPGAFDALESEYAMSGCKYMGCVVPTRVMVDGQPCTDIEIPGQPPNIPHMVGTGIYPPNVAKNTDGQWFYAKFESWDVFLRYYMARSLHHTSLIQHRWSTINYRREGDEIICDNDPKNPFGTDHAGAVDSRAVILHGCKDGSLAKLILESQGSQPIQLPPSAPVVQLTDGKKKGPPSPPPGVKYDNAAWIALQQKQAENKAIEIAKANPSITPPTPEVKIEETKADRVIPTKESIINALNGKSMRLVNLAPIFGMEDAELEALLPSLGFNIITGLKWVKLAVPPKKKIKIKRSFATA